MLFQSHSLSMENLMYKLILAITFSFVAHSLLAQDIDLKADPIELVTQVSNALFEGIDQNRAEYQENPAQLQALIRNKFLPLLDQERSARLILARHSRGLEPEQLQAFADALITQLVERYGSGLLEFNSRDAVQILPLVGNNTDRATKVRTRIQLSNGSTAPVDYVLRKTDDGWRAFDVIVEGISYIVTYRSQFGEEISRDGFDTVLERLQQGQINLDN